MVISVTELQFIESIKTIGRVFAIGRVSIDFDGMYSMLKKASIDVCSRKKKLKTTFKIGSAAAASMITKPH